jgi:hypothetical protein
MYEKPYFANVSGLPDNSNLETQVMQEQKKAVVLEEPLFPCPCGCAAVGAEEYVWVKSPRTGVEIRIPAKWYQNAGMKIVQRIMRAEGTGTNAAQFTTHELRMLWLVTQDVIAAQEGRNMPVRDRITLFTKRSLFHRR